MKKNKRPSYDLEKELLSDKFDFVFGMDEVGRGSFAGPLVASAVCFRKELNDSWFEEINDSKLLTTKKREELSVLILENADCFTEIIDVKTINEIGIGKCNTLIFEKLINNILKHYEAEVYFLIDGRNTFKSLNTQFIVKGDQKSISIAAASIVAKVYRDNLMRKYHKLYPQYNFLNNKGYGTKTHRDAIKQNGLIKIHRTSFNI